MSPGRWLRRLIPPALPAALLPASLLAGTLSLAAAGTAYAYQASVDVNETAFDECDGSANSTPATMLSAAVAAYKAMGYSTSGFTDTSFTKARTLNRTDDDWGFYVHSHGDYYWNAAAGRRYTGFREDSGDCDQKVVFSNEIKDARAGRQSNLIFISTCHAADSNATMPGAFAIAKTKYDSAASAGPEFYVGYVGVQWDSDEWEFERRFWNALTKGNGTGPAFDRAMAGSFDHASFDADWWGAYHWSGKAGPLTVSCPNCA